MSSDYLQSYNLAFRGVVPPNRPQSTMNDEFRAQRPIVSPGLVALDPKWLSFWAENLAARNIDVRRAMMSLRGSSNNWAALYQELPLPGAGEAVEYAIYARACAPGFVNTADDFGDMIAGLGVSITDFAFSPATADFITLHVNQARTGGAVQTMMEASMWGSYNAPNVQLAAMQTGVALSYLRARIRTTRSELPPLPPSTGYTTTLAFDVSDSGEAWTPVYQTTFGDACRQAFLGQRSSGGVEMTSFFDFFRIDADFTTGTTTGGRQQLGSV